MSLWPAHLCSVNVLHDFTGDTDDGGAFSVTSGQTILVQGDRTDCSSGWVATLIDGREECLVPSSYLGPRRSGVIPARALYAFSPADETELAFAEEDELSLMPSLSDPAGWVLASHKVTRERGLVPQKYMAAMPDARPSAAASPKPRTIAIDTSPVSTPSGAAVTPTVALHVAAASSPVPRALSGVASSPWGGSRSGSTPTSPGASGPRAAAKPPTAADVAGAAADVAEEEAEVVVAVEVAEDVAAAAAQFDEPAVDDQHGNGGVDCARGPVDAVPPELWPSVRTLAHDVDSHVHDVDGHAALEPEAEVASYVAREWGVRALASGAGPATRNPARSAAAAEPERASKLSMAEPPPPEGFEAAVAMDQIFHLGSLIAKGSTVAERGAEARIWRERIDYLNGCLQLWAAWEEAQLRREGCAASMLQATWIRRASYRRFQVALREARVRRLMADRAASSIQKGLARRAQALQLVTARRAAMRIQRHWRGLAGRRRAGVERQRQRQRETEEQERQRATEARRPLHQPLRLTKPTPNLGTVAAGADTAKDGVTAPCAAPPFPRRTPLAGLGRSLSFGLAGRRRASGVGGAGGRAGGGENGGSSAGAGDGGSARGTAGGGGGGSIVTPLALLDLRRTEGEERLAPAPTPGRPLSARLLRRSYSFDSHRARRKPQPPALGAPDADWQAQLDGELSIDRQEVVKPIRRSLSFTLRLSSRLSRAKAAASAVASAPKRKSDAGSGAPQSGSIDLLSSRTAALFVDDEDD